MNVVIIILIIVALLVLWWWFIGKNIPKYPPLDIKDDDPLMLEAIEKAKSSIGKFQKLYKAGGFSDVQIKIPFLSSSDVTEHLWAEVLGLNDSEVKVRYLTPPVTHTGKLERIHDHPIQEIEDWVVVSESGDIFGGYSQRVMFVRGREQWGSLPPELEAQESKYVT
ncbi:DUF2314 domain-containing protein [Gilvimarinus sp. SDUM040013]|uniref:DUF2314 domain-containing protein n=1 Tax=Gilvimarinus gilvus TaxID=3058038 RepID=A0ABU4RX89_9GAMM|nr:DUF2314 domain-containing protein [Gilvimarinus sp. SDUM040013]MDO3386606.1 DUF2314 domain-containing protein [Gilvimarinus sp. SDUM040013]MDX6849507.1 DUF2314 domain-containing protein [Gilvimarinus sp. SDUM040013]